MPRRLRLPTLATLSAVAVEDARVRNSALPRFRRADLEALEGLLRQLPDLVRGEPRAILVTAFDDEGAKAAAAVGLAATATASGQRTALVECDLGTPTLAARLGLNAVPGLREYLCFEARAPELLQPLVLAGPIGGRAAHPLTCIVAGGGTPRAAELLLDGGFAHAMARVRSAYERAVLVGAAVRSDTVALAATAAWADAILVCAGEAALKRRREEIGAALRELPARPAGAIAVG